MSANANSPALTIGRRDGRLLPLAGCIVCLFLMAFTSAVDATDPRPIVKGVDRAAAARVGRFRPASRFLESPGISIANLSRTTLARSDDVRGNLDELFELGIREGRLNELEAVRDLPLYAGMRTRGDFALLECLKVETCQLERFPPKRKPVRRKKARHNKKPGVPRCFNQTEKGSGVPLQVAPARGLTCRGFMSAGGAVQRRPQWSHAFHNR